MIVCGGRIICSIYIYMKGRMRTGVWKVRERWLVGRMEGGCGQARKPGVVKFWRKAKVEVTNEEDGRNV